MKCLISLLTFYLLWLMVDIIFKDINSFLGKKTFYSVLFKYVLYKLELTFMVPYLLIIKELILVFIRAPLVSIFTAALLYKLIIQFLIYAKSQFKEYFLYLNEVISGNSEHKRYYDSLEAKKIKTFKDLFLKRIYQGLFLNPWFQHK